MNIAALRRLYQLDLPSLLRSLSGLIEQARRAGLNADSLAGVQDGLQMLQAPGGHPEVLHWFDSKEVARLRPGQLVLVQTRKRNSNLSCPAVREAYFSARGWEFTSGTTICDEVVAFAFMPRGIPIEQDNAV